ncbi:MAG: hypothetical protein EOP04_25895 [Proteobacteria bacterium]|jgi:hypothetical protein|nr:MAG: hypothetical protein EOP04_25895 [Pseudomonadota bacterium]
MTDYFLSNEEEGRLHQISQEDLERRVEESVELEFNKVAEDARSFELISAYNLKAIYRRSLMDFIQARYKIIPDRSQ